jgi:hypothetical protein
MDWRYNHNDRNIRKEKRPGHKSPMFNSNNPHE